MTNQLTDLRIDISEALLFADIPAYSSPQPTTPVPSVTVSPGNPYVTPMSLKSNLVNLQLIVMVQAFDATASLQVIEDLSLRSISALPPGVMFEEMEAPQLVSLGEAQGKVYQTTITISAQVKD